MSPVIIFWLNTLKGTAKSTLKHPKSYKNRFSLLLKGTISTPILFMWEPSALWTYPPDKLKMFKSEYLNRRNAWVLRNLCRNSFRCTFLSSQQSPGLQTKCLFLQHKDLTYTDPWGYWHEIVCLSWWPISGSGSRQMKKRLCAVPQKYYWWILPLF